MNALFTFLCEWSSALHSSDMVAAATQADRLLFTGITARQRNGIECESKSIPIATNLQINFNRFQQYLFQFNYNITLIL